MCLLQGESVSPEIAGTCNRCSLYLDTCMPIIDNGNFTGAECDNSFCEECPCIGDCPADVEEV